MDPPASKRSDSTSKSVPGWLSPSETSARQAESICSSSVRLPMFVPAYTTLQMFEPKPAHELLLSEIVSRRL